VARRLSDAGVKQRLVVRDPGRAPRLAGAEVSDPTPYADQAAVRAALDGAETFFFVSGSEAADRAQEHARVVDAACEAGVQRIVYLSFCNAGPHATFTFARDHWHTEQRIRDCGMRFVFLRDNLYQDVLPLFVGEDRALRGPAGDGRFAPVCRDDVADVAAAVLTGEGHEGLTYDLSGPETLTMADVARVLSEASGQAVTYRAETVEEAYASRAGYGAPRWEVDGWVTTYAAIAAGELDRVTDHVERLSGHPATGFARFLERNPDLVARLRA
jgi:uncharacterized protein YbjT (DUF2867 family)